MNNLLLNMKSITKDFPGVKALDDVSFDLKAGEVHGLLGENGAGKSTLIKILAGDFPKDGGDIFINGAKVKLNSPSDSKNSGIQVIFQELLTMDTLSVAENIFTGALPTKKHLGIIDWKKLYKDAAAILKKMMVEIDPRTIVGDLTVHEKQIIEIARAIHEKAAILVMDEPTAALEEKDTASLFNIIRSLKKEGVGIIYISHRMNEIFEITDRVTVLRDGRKIGTYNTKETSRETLVSMMVGKTLKDFYPGKKRIAGETLLEVENLCISGILDNVSFNLRRGEILGLFGLMGSGRINIVKALYGLHKIDKGEIRIKGKPVSIQNPSDGSGCCMGYLPSDRKLEGLAMGLSVAENVSMANIDNLGKGVLIDKKLETSRVNKQVKDLNIKTPSLEIEVDTLSGGNQQKVVLSKLLEISPDIFIMIEPTRGIDVGAKIEIYEIMENLCAHGSGIIMISSELPEMISLADRILVILNGMIKKTFDRGEVDQERLLHAASA